MHAFAFAVTFCGVGFCQKKNSPIPDPQSLIPIPSPIPIPIPVPTPIFAFVQSDTGSVAKSCVAELGERQLVDAPELVLELVRDELELAASLPAARTSTQSLRTWT